MPAFARYIGVDYSGAQTPTASLKGLRVYLAEGDAAPVEVLPPPSPRKYWTRRGIAEWLVDRLSEGAATLVGIDHGFSFPLRYFEVHGLEPDWPSFLDDFQRHWPTDEDHTYVDFVRDGSAGNGAARGGNARWRRLTEERAGGAKSVFHFDVQGQVAKSTHAGIPWLRFIRQQLGDRVHFWPFDGWDIPEGRSGIAEVYPALWSRSFEYEIDFMTKDEDAAYARETEIISKLKRLHEGGPLTNLASGGGSSFGVAPVSKEKHSATLGGVPDDNPERAILNGFVLSIATMKSVVLKPAGQFTPRPTQRYPNKSMGTSLRQAVALIASAAANGIPMDEDCQIPRRVLVEGVSGLVENGVACDIATSGMATVIPSKNPADECFSLTEKQSRTAVGMVGLKKCFDLGILATFS